LPILLRKIQIFPKNPKFRGFERGFLKKLHFDPFPGIFRFSRPSKSVPRTDFTPYTPSPGNFSKKFIFSKNDPKSSNYSGKLSDGLFFVKNFKKKISKKSPKLLKTTQKCQKTGFSKSHFWENQR